MSDETRVVNPVTGGEKGQKLARFDLIPGYPELLLAEHYGRGARKYADRNWEKGYNWSLSMAALRRHLNAVQRGEWYDAETGSPHLVAVAWHAFALLEFSRTHPELNDLHPDLTRQALMQGFEEAVAETVAAVGTRFAELRPGETLTEWMKRTGLDGPVNRPPTPDPTSDGVIS